MTFIVVQCMCLCLQSLPVKSLVYVLGSICTSWGSKVIIMLVHYVLKIEFLSWEVAQMLGCLYAAHRNFPYKHVMYTRIHTCMHTHTHTEEKPLYDNEHGEEILSKHRPVQCTNSVEFQTIEDFAQNVEIVIQSCNRNEYCASLELMEAPQIPKPDGESQLFEKAV